MGYSTDFKGQINVMPPLSDEHATYLRHFAASRRMRREAQLTVERTDTAREAVGLGVGTDGGYFVNEDGRHGQAHGPDILDYNTPPTGQPSLWCLWVPNKDGTAIEWDGREKFYEYVAWMEYLIKRFLAPWGYMCNGEIRWRGEDFDDIGTLIVVDNVVTSTKVWTVSVI